MGRRWDYEQAITTILQTPFQTRNGTVVPTTDKVNLSNGGVYLDAVYLYADMADSTGMTRSFNQHECAKIVRAFLAAVSRVLRYYGGEIRSYDGDRVMAVFVGDEAASKAARAALEIKWVVDNVVRQGLSEELSNYAYSAWELSHRTGIDMGDAFIVRAGVRNNSDLVSIGDAPNVAAKLSELKLGRTMITDRLWQAMSYETCFSSNGGRPMWSQPEVRDVGGKAVSVRYSDWGWVVD